ncbi:DUF1801 domain-containing protein [Flavobacteriaceae bacterium S0825]|uniref:DUF1801 domain-containing protein n=1 Tax=Gaetbulibacter sp. S0825 TaxID=2720084 RepID=UPI001431346A|nr:DUF1801 domain-containing protein [Gaetbulibacter sp. S0825]MCK0107740.1 DUF1801 domain-containing protein [Flavobacteriaceae bacterium S0825]NIX63376.1 DUF1801 domain-containing protein [Gaetbulibacter sp. S0825]
MQSKATSPKQYLAELPEERKEPIQKLRQQILDNLPEGMEECMNYGMLGYVIPHSVYPPGYHCDPKLPLPFMNLASQKNFVAVYSMVIYAKKEVMDWFTSEYTKRCKYKLDMGKSCIRFKRLNDIPYDLIGELTSKVGAEEWIQIYEEAYKNRK